MYLVKNKATRLFLIDNYYRNRKDGTDQFRKAHKFSSFELLLASKTVLSNKVNYIVYDYDQLEEAEKDLIILEDLYEENSNITNSNNTSNRGNRIK